MNVRKILFYLVCLLALTVNLENFFDRMVGVDTPLNPYRISILMILSIVFFTSGTKGLKIEKSNLLILLVFVWAVVVGVIWNFLREVEFSLLLVNFVLFAINFFMFIAVYNMPLSNREIRYIFISYNLGLFLNLLLIQVSDEGMVNPDAQYVRESGYFTNPNSLALACLFGLLTSFFLYHKEKGWVQFFGIASMLNSLFLIDYSASRAGALVGAMLLLIILVWFFTVSDRSFGKVTVAIGILLAFIYYENFSIQAVERQNSRKARNVKEERDVLTAAGLAAFSESNFFGLGLGQFKSIDNFYRIVQPLSPGIAQERLRKNEGLVTHNSYIQVLAEAGLIGFIFLAVFFAHKFRNVIGNFRKDRDIFFFQFCAIMVMVVYAYAHVIFLAPMFWFFLAFIFPLKTYEPTHEEA